MDIFELMEKHGHEEVIFCLNEPSSLRAVIAIHDATLGPAMGGTRMWNYASEEEALQDVLRLSRSMTCQAAIAGCDYGGGKSVIWGDPREEKDEALLRAYGRFVQGLGGRFMTFADLGTSDSDMLTIARETDSVVATRLRSGELVDSARLTAYGAYWAIKACAKEVYGISSLDNRNIGIYGVGEVGGALVDYFRKEATHLTITDINYDAIKAVQDRHQGVRVVSPSELLKSEFEILVPCALGGILDHQAIMDLKCRILAGPASNILEKEEDGDLFQERGILYVPACTVNAGGTISPPEVENFADFEAMLKWAQDPTTLWRGFSPWPRSRRSLHIEPPGTWPATVLTRSERSGESCADLPSKEGHLSATCEIDSWVPRKQRRRST